MTNPRRLLTRLGLGFGAAGLVLQFVLSMQLHLGNGRDLPATLGIFFSYYTILSNILLVLIYLAEILPVKALDLFRHPVFRGMMAACIALVSLYVFFVLRYFSVLEGLFQLADTVLHYLCPTLYLLWWLIAQRHGLLRWAHLPFMLAPTLVYFVYVLARGAWVQLYPYPTLNPMGLGYPTVLLNAVYVALALGILCLIVIGLDRLLGTRRIAHG